jgi:lipoate-protein ligase A
VALATRTGPGPTVGTLLAPGLVKSSVEELYDYEVLRSLEEATMFVVRLAEPTLVLGSSQSLEILDTEKTGSLSIRRRRGGGGLVLLQPDDVWIDWWIPARDARWSGDVRASSLQVGGWWSDSLRDRVKGEISVHAGSLEGVALHRVVCFAGRGPGEVFVDGRKAVGLAQWRVREGNFLTSVLHTGSSAEVVNLLVDPPPGLREALNHHVTSSLAIDDPEELVDALASSSGPWLKRDLFLTA